MFRKAVKLFLIRSSLSFVLCTNHSLNICCWLWCWYWYCKWWTKRRNWFKKKITNTTHRKKLQDKSKTRTILLIITSVLFWTQLIYLFVFHWCYCC